MGGELVSDDSINSNAQVQPTRSLFSRADCDDIDAFVQTAAKLKSGGITFRRYKH